MILRPRTSAVPRRLRSASVRAATCALADALAKAVYLMRENRHRCDAIRRQWFLLSKRRTLRHRRAIMTSRRCAWANGISYLYVVGRCCVGRRAWAPVHYFVTYPGQFGDSAHPLQPWWLSFHVCPQRAFLIGFGSVLRAMCAARGCARNRLSARSFICSRY